MKELTHSKRIEVVNELPGVGCCSIAIIDGCLGLIMPDGREIPYQQDITYKSAKNVASTATITVLAQEDMPGRLFARINDKGVYEVFMPEGDLMPGQKDMTISSPVGGFVTLTVEILISKYIVNMGSQSD